MPKNTDELKARAIEPLVHAQCDPDTARGRATGWAHSRESQRANVMRSGKTASVGRFGYMSSRTSSALGKSSNTWSTMSFDFAEPPSFHHRS